MKRLSILAATAVATLSLPAEAGWTDGVLSITNARHDTVRVVIDHRPAGEVLAGDAEVYRLAPGRHDVQLLDARGGILKQEAVVIEAFRAEALLLDPAGGELDLTNQAGVALQVVVDGRPAGTIAPGACLELAVEPGRHKVSATFLQAGQQRTVFDQTLRIEPGEEEPVLFAPPSTGLVRITNDHAVSAQVQVNGAWAGSVGARQSVVVEAPVGEAWIAVVADGGRTLERERLVVSPTADNHMQVEVEMFGALSVHNPLPIPVVLKSGPQSRTLQPYERATWDRLKVGTRTVEVFRVTGEKIGDMAATIQPGRPTAMTVPAPREGIVAFTNAARSEALVYIDGQMVQRVPPGGQVRLPATVGSHEIRVFAEGRVVHLKNYTVDPFVDTVVVGVVGGHGGGRPGHHQGGGYSYSGR